MAKRSQAQIEAQERYRRAPKGKAAAKRYKSKPEVNVIQKEVKRRYYEERILSDPDFREQEKARFKLIYQQRKAKKLAEQR